MRRAEGTIRPGEGTVKAGQEFLMPSLILKYKSIFKTNLNLMIFI